MQQVSYLNEDLTTEQVQVITNQLLSGVYEGDEIQMSESTKNQIHMQYAENRVLKNQTEAIKEDFENSGFTNYKEYAKSREFVDENPIPMKYSLAHYGFDEEEKKVVQNYIGENLLEGYLDFSSDTEIISALMDEDVIDYDTKDGVRIPKRTTVTIRELVDAGLVEPKTKRWKEEQEEFLLTTESTSTWYNPLTWGDEKEVMESTGDYKPVTMTSTLPQLQDFEIVPSSVGIGNAIDRNGEVNLAVKVNTKGGTQRVLKYPTSKLGESRINEKINISNKILKTKTLLAKGARIPEYKLNPNLIVRMVGSQQHLYENIPGESIKDYGPLTSLSEKTLMNLSKVIFE